MKGKKIAILNMMYDNNYGGNLQRYAMVTLLLRMGYEVEYLYIRSEWKEDWMHSGSLVKRVYRFLRQVVAHIIHPKTEQSLNDKLTSERTNIVIESPSTADLNRLLGIDNSGR